MNNVGKRHYVDTVEEANYGRYSITGEYLEIIDEIEGVYKGCYLICERENGELIICKEEQLYELFM